LEELLYGPNEICETTPYPRLLAIKQKTATSPQSLAILMDYLRNICYYNPDKADNFRNKQLLHNALKDFFPSLKYQTNEDHY
jgi:hypothetical protein